MSRLLAACGALCLVIAGSAGAASLSDGSLPAPVRVTRLVTHVPASTLDKVGAGPIPSDPSFVVSKVRGAAVRGAGKPELLATIFAWCPHCAANSWSLAAALSRFGTLNGVRIIDTGTLYPQWHHTHGLSFFRVHFKSRYLSFLPVVLQDVNGRSLQSETASEQKAIGSFDPNGTPAVDVGGRWGFVGSGYSPTVLTGKSWSQIASSLAHSGTVTARSIDGLANLFSAAICKVTRGKPTRVCASHGVVAAARHLR